MSSTSRSRRAYLGMASGIVLLAACGSRTGLDSPPPLPPPPECLVDQDCPTFGDLCNPVRCSPFPAEPGKTTPKGGFCEALPKIDCNDKNPCTADECDPKTGQCSYSIATFDLDGDGFRAPLPGTIAGQPGSCGDDCDDTNREAFPGSREVCDGVDNDCNGIVDDNASFVPQGKEIRVSGNLSPASPGGLAFATNVDDGIYAAVYTGSTSQGFSVYDALLTPSGEKRMPPGEKRIPEVNADSMGGPVLWVGNSFGVAWQDRRDGGNYQIFFNQLGSDGAKKFPDLKVSFEEDGFVGSVNPAMAWNGTEFLLVWQAAPEGRYQLFGQRIRVGTAAAKPAPMLPNPIVLTGTELGSGSEAPSVAAGIGGVGITWALGDATDNRIAFQIFATDLSKAISPIIDLTDGTSKAVFPNVVWNNDRYVVAWADWSKNPKAIYAASVGPNGDILTPPKAISNPGRWNSRYPYLRPLGDRLLVVYQDDRDNPNAGYEIYARMIASSLDPLGSEQRITNAPGDSTNPIAAFGPKGDVGVLFRDHRLGQHDVWFTRLGCVAGKVP